MLRLLILTTMILFVGCYQHAPSSVSAPSAAAPNENLLASLGLPSDTNIKVKEVRFVDEFESLVQFETVFWEPPDTTSLRKLICETDLVHDKRVLEIGSGTGIVSLCCLKARAAKVVATDINPSAIANTWFNANNLGLATRLEVRLVSKDDPAAFAVLKPGEQFDLIISNPPWEDADTTDFESNAFFDPQFALLQSLLTDFDQHLAPGGRLLLAYGCVDAIREIQSIAKTRRLKCTIKDDRNLDELPNLFLPGMLIEITR